MQNRIKRFNRDNTDVEKLLKEAERNINKVFAGINFSEVEHDGKILENWQVELQKVMLFEQAKSKDESILLEINSSQDVSNLIGVLNAIANILKDGEAPDEQKAFLTYIFRLRLCTVAMPHDNERAKELFNRRREIADSPLKDFFMHDYIGDEVYSCFYETKYKEMERNGVDIDEHEENLSDNEKNRANKEWEKHFTALCLKYNEEKLIEWQDDTSILDKLPEDIKAGIDRATAEMDKEIEELERLENEKQDKKI